MPTCEDAPFVFEALCLANKYLLAPNATYIVRPRAGSITRDLNKISFSQHMHKRLGALNDGFNEFERIMNKIKFFSERPDYRYAVLSWFANSRIQITLGFYTQIPAFQLNELVKKEFHPDDAALASYLFNTVNVYRIQIMKLQQELNALKSGK